MRERLNPQPQNVRSVTPDNMERQALISSPQRESNPQVGTVVKVSVGEAAWTFSSIHMGIHVLQLSSDGFGSYISPTHHNQQSTPLVPRDLGEDFTLELIDDERDPRLPKNAK